MFTERLRITLRSYLKPASLLLLAIVNIWLGAFLLMNYDTINKIISYVKDLEKACDPVNATLSDKSAISYIRPKVIISAETFCNIGRSIDELAHSALYPTILAVFAGIAFILWGILELIELSVRAHDWLRRRKAYNKSCHFTRGLYHDRG